MRKCSCHRQPIPGHERRNSDYLLENGIAVKIGLWATLPYKRNKVLSSPMLNPRRMESRASRRTSERTGSVDNGLLFVQCVSYQTIQVCVCYRGKIALSIKLFVHYAHNADQGCGDQNAYHTEGGDT